ERLRAFVLGVDDNGNVRLGRAADRPDGVAALEEAAASGLPLTGKITGHNKGGLEVDLGGVRGFCPMSQIDVRPVSDVASWVGRSASFRVLEVKEGGRRVVVSRRAVAEEEAREAADRAGERLAEGVTVRGLVTSVRDFGAFVDLGGVEGLVPASELTHDRALKPADVVKVGEAVEVLVRERKRDERGQLKVTLSLKALAADPWDAIDVVAPVGKVAAGTVERTAEFGVFVRLAAGVVGLLHVSELGGGSNAHPSSRYKPGDPMLVVVQSIDREARRLSLAPAPDAVAAGTTVRAAQVVVGALVSGTVERVEPFGVFVQIDGTRGKAGRGLVPNAELGVPRGADVRKLFPLGKRIENAKVLESSQGRIRLSVRAAEEDRERAEFDGFRRDAGASAPLGTLGDRLRAKAPKGKR
ncbi:MAG: S1 RNA-binding domain-containing protein, partial [Deltaproteobacteria bacterium]|nr:S1 RNA-binding domain-containing protein [Deltaproteobacteria bacterium]